MKAIQKTYQRETDFMRVRDFLVRTFALTEKPLNWRLERWTYARYFVTPMLADYHHETSDPDRIAAAHQLLDESTALWENEAGELAGLVTIEHADKTHPDWGEVFIQQHPAYDHILPEMLAYAETHLRNVKKNQVFLSVYDYDEPLLAEVQARGYERLEKYTLWDAVYPVKGEIPAPVVPADFTIHAMVDPGSDVDRRRKAFGQGFNHPDPVEWPSRPAYESLQRAPDYRPELDIYVKAPDGEYAAFCIAWWDEANRIACLEPVGTIPEHRRKGLASAAVYEAMRRAAALGAERIFVGSDQEFYLSIGFELAYPAHPWIKKF